MRGNVAGVVLRLRHHLYNRNASRVLILPRYIVFAVVTITPRATA